MLDPQLKKAAVQIYKDFFDDEGADLWPLVTAAIKMRPDDWILPHHFDWGMHMRNMLRENGLYDSLLPGETTWDDYYVELIEIALGFKDMEGNRIEKAYDKTHVHSLFISTTIADLIGIQDRRNPRAG